METVIQGSTLQTLRAGLRGTAHAPGEEGYEEASRAWNLAAHQNPAPGAVRSGSRKVLVLRYTHSFRLLDGDQLSPSILTPNAMEQKAVA